jgi:hypothetical protein
MSSRDGGEKKDLLRITNQFRQKNSMIYDLRGDGSRLVIAIRGREAEAEPADFCVEARSGTQTDATTLAAWGASKSDALKSVGDAWTLRRDLAVVDWEAIARVLANVRAV